MARTKAALLLVAFAVAAAGIATGAAAQDSWQLAVDPLVEPDGSALGYGTVTSDLPGIACPLQCSADFAQEQVVQLSADAADGYAFDGFDFPTGGVTCAGAGCTARFTGSLFESVSARFRAVNTLAVVPAGAGSVVSRPSGIGAVEECRYVENTIVAGCTAGFRLGARVTLMARPDAGARFVRWSDWRCRRSGGKCKVRLRQGGRRTVAAVFSPLRLTVARAGQGRVTSPEIGIDCGDGCSTATAQVEHGTRVTLVAEPTEPAAPFREWLGGCAGQGSTCTIKLRHDEWLVPLFGNDTANVPPRADNSVTVEKTGRGRGRVLGTAPAAGGGGFRCGPSRRSCTRDGYRLDQAVRLIARARRGSRFVTWGRPCGRSRNCSMAAGGYTSVRVIFRRRR